MLLNQIFSSRIILNHQFFFLSTVFFSTLFKLTFPNLKQTNKKQQISGFRNAADLRNLNSILTESWKTEKSIILLREVRSHGKSLLPKLDRHQAQSRVLTRAATSAVNSVRAGRPTMIEKLLKPPRGHVRELKTRESEVLWFSYFNL